MLDMRRASIREIQHHLSKVLRYVEEGEEVYITRRNKIIAKIVPQAEPATGDVEYPKFTERAKKNLRSGNRKPLSDTIVEQRDERI
jgi:prevent-host-death family protein